MVNDGIARENASRPGQASRQVDRDAGRAASTLDRILAGIAAAARYPADHDSYLDMNLRAAPEGEQ